MSEKLDYKKEYKDLYLPKTEPVTVLVPPIPFIMIDGKGDPNEEQGAYQQAVELLYALSFTIKMSKMGGALPEGYFEYVMPPLEGLWWMWDGFKGVDYSRKNDFCWVSMIRQPEFVTEELFFWACGEVQRKKGLDTASAYFNFFDEGLCVQCMHIGSFDTEPETVAKMEKYMQENRLITDIGEVRRHHEIYLSDPRKTDKTKLKTVLRVPVREE